MDHAAAETHSGPGRPRGYDRIAVLDAALNLFWRQGYETTSLDMLTEAMGISRSSFYACFGSKRAVLVAALESYASKARSAMPEAGQGAPALLLAIVDPAGGARGCLLVNCITELAPHDPEVAALGRAHLAHIEALFACALAPDRPETAAGTARALTAVALGALTMRKSGVPAVQIQATLDAAGALIAPPS